ncbi:MAG: MarR family transcriptional regulator [Acidobacteria bacterium]|nr:MarR family transcriptional regulator [Acidobacteriota bacterium]
MARVRKTNPTEVADRLHSAAIHLLRHARQRDVLTQEGPARLSALSVLVFIGPMTLGQLAAAEQVKPPTMSRIVAGLKAAGLVKSEGDAQDARRIHVSATSKGRTLLQQARERRIQLLAETFAGVSDPEILILQEAAEIIEKAVRAAR